MRWTVERIVHFAADEFVRDGLAHFGFHDPHGHFYPIAHQRHIVGSVHGGGLEWTLASHPFAPDVPNITADLDFPMFVDTLPDGALVVSNFGNARLYRVDPAAMSAELLVDGHSLGMADMGNVVVDGRGDLWVNEVTGCRVWRLGPRGQVIDALGDGHPGFQAGTVDFAAARFSWIYDLRRGPRGELYVLDSRNFAVRRIDPDRREVTTVAGTGHPGYTGDGAPARTATFGSDPTARFDGPISLSVDDAGNLYVGDRHNHVVRMVTARTGVISTIAGRPDADPDRANDDAETDPMRLNLPQISSMDVSRGRLYVPTDLGEGQGDLAVLAARR